MTVMKNGWFTPTHVGNSLPVQYSAVQPMVHPHACGELAVDLVKEVICDGSSPRMWGTRPQYVRSPKQSTVHPHACGELER